MSTDVPLKCLCGSVTGWARNVSPETGNHAVCMCDDCQAFACYLGREADMLDAHGGTDIYQLAPCQLEITAGSEHLRCMRLSPKGLLRWHTACCKTPVANTLANPRVPFAGVLQPFMDHAADGRSRDEVLGPPLAKVFGRFSRGPMPPDAHGKVPVAFMLRMGRMLAVGSIRRRHTPSPFFVDGRPVSEPAVLTPAEREGLLQQVPARH